MIFRKFILIGITILFTACPAPSLDPGPCYTQINIDDGASLSPLKDSFIVGEILTIEINIPVEVENDNGEKYNLFEIFKEETIRTTGIGSGLGLQELFEGNQFNILKGELTEDFLINLQYNSETGNYEFLVEIELIKEGRYLTQLFKFDVFLGNNEDNCSENKRITSNFVSPEKNGRVGNFTVASE